MKSYTEKIDEESKKAFKKLASSQIQFLYSPSVEVSYDSQILIVQNVSIPIGPGEYVIVDNDWSDTPEEAVNYYFLKARVSDKPKGIEVEEYEEGKAWTSFKKNDHFSFHIRGQEKVTKVIVLEYELEIGKERVEYDAGILIELESGKRISVIREQSITGFLEITDSDKEIENYLSELKQGKVYNA